MAILVGTTLALGACGGGSGDTADGGTGGDSYTPGDGAGTALLTWTAPAEREDGSSLALNEVAGYRIHFGPAAEPEQYVIEVRDARQSQYSVTGLEPATYSFAVSVFDTAGEESGYSNTMTKVISN